MKIRIYQIISSYYIYIILISLLLLSILYTYNIISLEFISNILVTLGIIGLLIYISYSFIYKTIPIYNFFIIPLYLFLLLSYFNAYDKRIALYGYIQGREGLLVILSYYIYFLVSTTIHNQKVFHNIFNLLTIIGLIQCIYIIIQGLYIKDILGIKIIYNIKSYPGSFLSNCNFFASFISIILGLWIPKYLFSNNSINFKYLFIISIFIISSLISSTMSIIVTIIFIITISIIFIILKRKHLILRKNLLKLILLFIIIISSTYLVTKLPNNNLYQDLITFTKETQSTIKGDINENFGTGRIHIWKQTLKYLDKYFLTGIGIDNFIYIAHTDGVYIYDKIDANLPNSYIVYKAHNEYLQILSTEGIFTLTIYISLILFILIKSILNLIKKTSINILQVSYLFSTVAYLFQATFNFRTPLIAPIFFIILGILSNNFEIKKEIPKIS